MGDVLIWHVECTASYSQCTIRPDGPLKKARSQALALLRRDASELHHSPLVSSVMLARDQQNGAGGDSGGGESGGCGDSGGDDGVGGGLGGCGCDGVGGKHGRGGDGGQGGGCRGGALGDGPSGGTDGCGGGSEGGQKRSQAPHVRWHSEATEARSQCPPRALVSQNAVGRFERSRSTQSVRALLPG